MKPSSTLYKNCLKNAVKYKGLDEELEEMTKPSGKRARADESNEDSDEEDIIPPTPAKRKAASSVLPAKTKAKAPSASNTAAPSVTSKSSSKTSMAPPVTSEAPNPKKSKPLQTTAPPVTSEAPSPKKSNTSQSSKPSDALSCPSTSVQSESSFNEPSHEDPEDDSKYLMAKDFFEERDPKTNRHKWLCFFYRYLFTPRAGFHKDQNRLQHACQVKKLIEETDPRGDDIAFLAEEEGNRAWIDWVIPNIQKKKPGTLKSYLTSFEIFLDYVLMKGTRSHLPELDPEVKNQLSDLCTGLKKWRRCITKETTSLKWDRYLNESDQLLTNEEVEDILSSKPAVDGRVALLAADQAESTEHLSIKQYCDARDFLIVTLTRAVGTRAAALENATLEMFYKAKWDDNKQRKVMLVSSHKREEDGPAAILMSPETEYLVEIFINKLRPLVTDEMSPRSKIFLKNEGTPFQRGTIGRRVHVFVIKSGIRPDKAISATDFRKWIVTKLKRKKRMGLPIDEQLLRRLMCHSDKTANKWYLRESLTQEAAEASVMIAEHTQPAKAVSKHKSPAPTQKHLEEDTAPQDTVLPKHNPATSTKSGSSEKICLSVAQRDRVDLVFAEDIQSGIEPRKKCVVALMSSDLILHGLINSQPHVKWVVDRVRYLFDKRSSVDPFDLP